MAATELIPALRPPWFTWGGPGSPLQVRFRLLAVEGLEQLLARLADAPPLDSRALGGILIGNRNRPGITEITGFRPLPKLDAVSVEKALHENGNTTAGYYRVILEGKPELTDADTPITALLSEHPNLVVLLIDGVSCPAMASFRHWHQGALTGQQEFPLNAALLSEIERDQLNAIAAPSNKNRLKQLTRAIPEGVQAAPKPVPARYVTWTLVIVSVTFAATAIFLRRTKLTETVSRYTAPRSSAAAQPSLGFRTERSGKDLFFTWDRNSPAIANATFGMITVTSGSDRRKIVLTLEELRTGKVFYSPTADQTDVELSVVRSDRTLVRESLIIVLQPADFAGPSSVPTVPERDPLPELLAGDAQLTTSNPPVTETQPRPPVPRRIFVAPQRRKEATTPVVEELAPKLDAQLPAAPTFGQLARPVEVARSAAAAPVPVAVSLPETLPAITKTASSASVYRPAEVIEKSRALLPKLFAPFFANPAYVDVSLTVEADGSVSNATLLTPHLNPALAKAALDSSRQWRFRAAREGDQPVSSQVVIRFKLDPHS